MILFPCDSNPLHYAMLTLHDFYHLSTHPLVQPGNSMFNISFLIFQLSKNADFGPFFIFGIQKPLLYSKRGFCTGKMINYEIRQSL